MQTAALRCILSQVLSTTWLLKAYALVGCCESSCHAISVSLAAKCLGRRARNSRVCSAQAEPGPVWSSDTWAVMSHRRRWLPHTPPKRRQRKPKIKFRTTVVVQCSQGWCQTTFTRHLAPSLRHEVAIGFPAACCLCQLSTSYRKRLPKMHGRSSPSATAVVPFCCSTASFVTRLQKCSTSSNRPYDRCRQSHRLNRSDPRSASCSSSTCSGDGATTSTPANRRTTNRGALLRLNAHF
mmetsp:Transcript_34671/g.107089  ORF Transcript_34671/g.107089 Transcript_34671/m.107089 type:complete len:238 (+) Transcript_34671:735-1448(+)